MVNLVLYEWYGRIPTLFAELQDDQEMLNIDVLTLFPEAFAGFLAHSIIGRAVEQGIVKIRLHNIRSFTHDKHHTVDDYPYGGGAGMVMKPEPIFEAVESVKAERGSGISGDTADPPGQAAHAGAGWKTGRQ
jgi:tRNA G37 N-methylase TrmD